MKGGRISDRPIRCPLIPETLISSTGLISWNCIYYSLVLRASGWIYLHGLMKFRVNIYLYHFCMLSHGGSAIPARVGHMI